MGTRIFCVMSVDADKRVAHVEFRDSGRVTEDVGCLVNGKLALGADPTLPLWWRAGDILHFRSGPATVTAIERVGQQTYLCFDRPLDPAQEGTPVRATADLTPFPPSTE